MTVVIADISAASIDSAIEQITASVAGASVVGQVTDVADEASVRDLHGRVYSELHEVGFLFNNAGLSRDETFSAYRTPLEHWRTTLDVNLFGVRDPARPLPCPPPPRTVPSSTSTGSVFTLQVPEHYFINHPSLDSLTSRVLGR